MCKYFVVAVTSVYPKRFVSLCFPDRWPTCKQTRSTDLHSTIISYLTSWDLVCPRTLFRKTKHYFPHKFRPYLICLFERGKNIVVSMKQTFMSANKVERMILWRVLSYICGTLQQGFEVGKKVSSARNTTQETWECTVMVLSAGHVGNDKNKRKISKQLPWDKWWSDLWIHSLQQRKRTTACCNQSVTMLDCLCTTEI